MALFRRTDTHRNPEDYRNVAEKGYVSELRCEAVRKVSFFTARTTVRLVRNYISFRCSRFRPARTDEHGGSHYTQ
jgi:hypothetical protein